MSVRYADTSTLVRCYLVDEADHERLRALLLEGREPVVTSELTRVELASALSTAARSGRLRRPDWLLARANAAGKPLEFVTCDQRQAQTAEALGLIVA